MAATDITVDAAKHGARCDGPGGPCNLGMRAFLHHANDKVAGAHRRGAPLWLKVGDEALLCDSSMA